MTRRILLVVAVLVFTIPALAAVDVNAVKVDANSFNVTYSVSGGDRIRALALDVNIDNGVTFSGVSGYKTGESNSVSPGYGIFPGRFRDYIDAANPNWVDPNYTPVAPAGDPDARGGIGTGGVTLELGSLYVGDGNKPATAGTLCKLNVNRGGVNDANVSLYVNATRGKVVKEDANEATTNLPRVVHIVFLNTVPVPNVVGMTMADANTAITNATLVVGTISYAYSSTVPAGTVISQVPIGGTEVNPGSAVNYTASKGRPLVPNILNMTKVQADANIRAVDDLNVGVVDSNWSLTVVKGKVISQSPIGGTEVNVGSLVNYTLSAGVQPSNCFDPCTTAWSQQKAQYNSYIAKKWDPNCWCQYSIGSGFQCHGDADGKKTPDGYRIFTGDLTLITSNWKAKLSTYPFGANPCADIDHKATPDGYRVFTADLTRVTTNWKRKDSPAVGGLPRNCPLNDANNNVYVKP
jgi:hypothetical protein